MSITISSEEAAAAVTLEAPATTMSTVFLGQGAPLDDVKSNAAVAINSAGNITLVHTEGDTMYYRFGSCRAGTVDWRGVLPIRAGSFPAVSNTPAYAVVAFRDDSTDPRVVRALVGAYVPSGISWTGTVAVDAGDRPSIAVNEAGRYVIAYESAAYAGSLRYGTGSTDGVAITLSSAGQTLPNGTRPAIALNNHNEVALAYESGESIVLVIGTLDGALLRTVSTTTIVKKGEDPSIALTDDDLVIVTFRGKESALRQVCVQLANGVPSRINERGYDAGSSSSVAAAGDLAIEVHARGSKLVYANSIVTSRGTWMADRAAKLGGRPLKTLVLPASHDAGMYRSEIDLARPWVQTQSQRILRQLEDGVRWFDLRLMRVNNHIVLHHSGWKGPRLAEVIGDLKAFLQAGRRELILLKFSSFKDFHASTWAHFANQMKELDAWMFKRSAAQGRRLADLTLNDYTANGSRLVALTTRRNPALPAEDYWLYRGDGEDAADGDLRVYDHYSGTEDFNEMKTEQVQQFADYTGLCQDGSPCELFLFSWTLTPKDLTVIPPPIPLPSSVRSLAEKANPYLGQTVANTPVPNGHGQIMNLLYVDFLQYARVCDVALYQMGAAGV